MSDRSNKIPPAESKDKSLAKEPDVIFAADKFGILAVANVPDVTLPAPIDMTGTRAESNTPDVILDVARLGISFASKLILALSIVPDVILLASIWIAGILAESIVPDVILLALTCIAGILAESNVPDVISEVARSGSLAESNTPAFILDAFKLYYIFQKKNLIFSIYSVLVLGYNKIF